MLSAHLPRIFDGGQVLLDSGRLLNIPQEPPPPHALDIRLWQSPVNDRDDPCLTHEGQLVFAVQREPVDGGSCLVRVVLD